MGTTISIILTKLNHSIEKSLYYLYQYAVCDLISLEDWNYLNLSSTGLFNICMNKIFSGKITSFFFFFFSIR